MTTHQCEGIIQNFGRCHNPARFKVRRKLQPNEKFWLCAPCYDLLMDQEWVIWEDTW